MTPDEELTDRLRSSLRVATADVFHRSDLLDGIAPRPTRWLPLPRTEGLAGMIAAASAIAVALFAVIALSHSHSRTAPPVAPLNQSADKPTSLPALRSQLAILRRPQRHADKLPAGGVTAERRPDCSSCLNVVKVLGRETRLLTTLQIPHADTADGRGDERVYLVLGTVPARWGNGLISGWRQHGPAIRGLHMTLVGLSRRSAYAAPLDELLNSVQIPMPAAALTPRDAMITSFATIGVVPDGVTRVKWELTNPGQRKPAIVYPRVRGNVATAPDTPAPVSTRLGNEQWLAGATWYGSDGQVIASFHDLAAINGQLHH
jgi:hypothetical protein